MCECLDTLVVNYATLEYTQHWETQTRSRYYVCYPSEKIMSTIYSIVFSRLNAPKRRQVEVYFWNLNLGISILGGK